jgi:hypothetical protein
VGACVRACVRACMHAPFDPPPIAWSTRVKWPLRWGWLRWPLSANGHLKSLRLRWSGYCTKDTIFDSVGRLCRTPLLRW